MIHAIGYAGVCLGLLDRSISRTMRVVNATPERLLAAARANLTDLQAILAYNVAQRFCLFRINQAIIPLISHPANTLAWWEDCADLLEANGAFVRANRLRVSMHPGQYTVLNSTRPEVVASAIGELAATCRVLDAMGLDGTHRVIVHGGAGTPDRLTALARLESAWPRLPGHVARRITLENDDRVFSAADLLPVCARLGVPLVFDWLHHRALPGPWADRPVAEVMAACAATWQPEHGLPKFHFSSQDPAKKPGAHAYDLDPEDFLRFREASNGLEVDVMAECKGKDLALLTLREALGWALSAC